MASRPRATPSGTGELPQRGSVSLFATGRDWSFGLAPNGSGDLFSRNAGTDTIVDDP
jgi:hypothetical protein